MTWALSIAGLALLVMTATALAAPGSQLWLKRYNGPANGEDQAQALGVSPDGSKVFVTGGSERSNAGDYATIAYDATTGQRLWVKRYPGVFDEQGGVALGVSPDGAKVFVTGIGDGSNGYGDYATVAYSASTGATLWVKRYNGPANGPDWANALGVSRDGSKVFVTGESYGNGSSSSDYATIAYDASTGAMLWVRRYDGPADFARDAATALGVSRDGSKVFVTGNSQRSNELTDYATVAYNASTGQRLWVKRYGLANDQDAAHALGVGPGGAKVFVTGASDVNYATVAYDASTGAKLWVRSYNGPGQGLRDIDVAKALAVGPNGSKVYVTGQSDASNGFPDYATIAYDASTGQRLWLRRYNGPANDYGDGANALGVGPDGSKVYVTGESAGSTSNGDYATVAYGTSTGAQLWVKRYNGGANGGDGGDALGVSPVGSKLFVTGGTTVTTSDSDYATIAYSTG